MASGTLSKPIKLKVYNISGTLNSGSNLTLTDIANKTIMAVSITTPVSALVVPGVNSAGVNILQLRGTINWDKFPENTAVTGTVYYMD